MNVYLDVLSKYAVFSGRATRSEYWIFTLFSCLIVLVIGFGAWFLATKVGASPTVGFNNARILMGLYSLGVLLPTIGVSVRRLHDIGWSGWWCLLELLGPLGGLVLLVVSCLDSQPGPNQYGPNPKEIDAFSTA